MIQDNHDSIGPQSPKDGEPMSTVQVHALRELRLIRMDADDSVLIVKIISLIQECSPAVSTDLIAKLMNEEILSPISNRAEEWVNLGDQTWQSLRNPNLYSNTAGNTYWDVTENGRSSHEKKLHVSLRVD